VNKKRNLARRESGLATLRDRMNDALRGVLRRGQRFADIDPAGCLLEGDEVGKRAAGAASLDRSGGRMSGREAAPNHNLAFFSTQQKSLFTGFLRSIGAVAPIGRVFIVASDDKAVDAAKTAALRATKSEVQATSFSALGFLQVPVSFREIAHRITDWMGLAHDGAILAVDELGASDQFGDGEFREVDGRRRGSGREYRFDRGVAL
jgi:hypothetical protein